jgi:hypothetical protein
MPGLWRLLVLVAAFTVGSSMAKLKRPVGFGFKGAKIWFDWDDAACWHLCG